METTQISVNRRVDKNAKYSYNEILLNIKKELTSDTYINRDKFLKHYIDIVYTFTPCLDKYTSTKYNIQGVQFEGCAAHTIL